MKEKTEQPEFVITADDINERVKHINLEINRKVKEIHNEIAEELYKYLMEFLESTEEK